MRDRPVVTIDGVDVRSNGIHVGKCLKRPGEKWDKKINGRDDHFVRVIFFARYNLPVIGANSYDDARVKVAEALRGSEDP